jgi:tellurite resistance protein TerC
MKMTLFPWADFWWIYASVAAIVVLTFVVYVSRSQQSLDFKSSLRRVCGWVAVAILFDVFLYVVCQRAGYVRQARSVALEFAAGYLTELALSVDNLFVFVLVFRFFGVDKIHQQQVLFLGIIGAILFRGLFILLGTALMGFHWVVAAFGAFLIFTGAQLLRPKHESEDVQDNWLLRLLKRWLPLKEEAATGKLFVRSGGQTFATPLFLCLCFLEVSDVIFAFDSVPAVFGLTREPMIVFTSNIFAILGLRSLYFIVAEAMDLFRFLQYGLGVLLIFVGAKMAFFPDVISIGMSLLVILSILMVSIGLSVWISPASIKKS